MREFQGETDVIRENFSFRVIACCHSKMFRNLFNNAYNTLCSIIVENLHEESLVAQRLVYDSVNALGGIKKIDTIPIIKEMLKSVKDSNRNYKIALDKRKEADNREIEERLARKRKQDMIKEIEEKKRVVLVNSKNQLLEMQAEIGQLKMASK